MCVLCFCLPGVCVCEHDGRCVRVSHGVHVVPAAVRPAARSPCQAAASLRAPAFSVVSGRSVRLPVETLREELHSAGRLLLQQGQSTRGELHTCGESFSFPSWSNRCFLQSYQNKCLEKLIQNYM